MIVHVYFVSQFYRVFVRTLLVNFITLISQLGGVYSLLMGMSIIGLVEVIYFLTIRLHRNYRNIKDEDNKPKTFSQRLDKVTINTIKVPRLDTAKSDISEISSFRVSSVRHYWMFCSQFWVWRFYLSEKSQSIERRQESKSSIFLCAEFGFISKNKNLNNFFVAHNFFLYTFQIEVISTGGNK